MRTGPLPLRAAPSVTALLDISRMNDQASSLLVEFAVMHIAQNSVTDDICWLRARRLAEAGNSIALMRPGKRDWSSRLSWAWRAKGSTVKAARPCWIQVTWSSLVVAA